MIRPTIALTFLALTSASALAADDPRITEMGQDQAAMISSMRHVVADMGELLQQLTAARAAACPTTTPKPAAPH